MTTIEEVAGAYAGVAIRNICTEFPHATQHVVRGPDEPSRPRELHPAFHGSFDWHSCVHMHWLLARLAGDEVPGLDTAPIGATLDRTLTRPAVETEAAYLREHPSFERPYGWAWSLALAAACERGTARRWSAAVAPLADAVEDMVPPWLERVVAPIRHGVHVNTAFGLALLHESASALGRLALVTTVAEHAVSWFGGDRNYSAEWEPSGQDFLSPALSEADLMRRVLPSGEFADWLGGFLPDPVAVFTPAEVRDPTDGYQVHLYGLNLSRAWQFRNLAAALPSGDRRVAPLREAADRHEAAGLPYVCGKGFVSDHWLATFAYLALTA